MTNKQIRHYFDDAIQRKLKYIDIPPIYCRLKQITEVINKILLADDRVQNIHHLGKGLYLIEYAEGG